MEPLALGRPPATSEIGEGTVAPSPPGTERIETLMVVVGIVIFMALALGAVVILVRKHRRR